jgi:hypothetical protein
MRRAPLVAALLVAVLSVLFVGSALIPGPSVAGGSRGSTVPTRVSNDLLCNGGQWNTTHLEVWASGCQAVFGVVWAQNFSSMNSTNQYNFSFNIGWIVEFTPSGQLVRAASPLDPYGATANATVGPHEVNLTSITHMNVTNASGKWTPGDAFYGPGPQWNVSTTPVGVTELTVVFHLLNVAPGGSSNVTGNASLAVKFDIGIASWPWVSSTDLLGLEIGSLGAVGSHFAFNQSSRTLAENWNTSNTTFASLIFGAGAMASYPNQTSAPASVVEQVGLFGAATAAREAVALVNFAGIPGNYSYVSYDPWVVFSPSGTTVVPPGHRPSSGGMAVPAWLVTALGVLAAVAGMTFLAVHVARSSVLRKEGLELVREMRNAISDRGRPPPRP